MSVVIEDRELLWRGITETTCIYAVFRDSAKLIVQWGFMSVDVSSATSIAMHKI